MHILPTELRLYLQTYPPRLPAWSQGQNSAVTIVSERHQPTQRRGEGGRNGGDTPGPWHLQGGLLVPLDRSATVSLDSLEHHLMGFAPLIVTSGPGHEAAVASGELELDGAHVLRRFGHLGLVDGNEFVF